MPPLNNRRHEAFAQALFEGLSDGITQREAYISAGYRARGHSAKVNACRLLKIAPAIAARVRELQTEAAKEARETAEKVVGELNAIMKDAREDRAHSAAVAAANSKARILGLDAPQRTEIGKPGDFSDVESTAELVDRLLRDRGASHVSEDMRAMALAELERHAAAVAAIVSNSETEQQ